MEKLKVFCTEKIRSNNKITGYRTRDIRAGQQTTVDPEALKLNIRNNKLEVVNLMLTSDNRLINAGSRCQ